MSCESACAQDAIAKPRSSRSLPGLQHAGRQAAGPQWHLPPKAWPTRCAGWQKPIDAQTTDPVLCEHRVQDQLQLIFGRWLTDTP